MSVTYSKGAVVIDQTSSSSSGSTFPDANLAWKVIDPINGLAPSLLNLSLTSNSIQVANAANAGLSSSLIWTLHYYNFTVGSAAPSSPSVTSVVVTPVSNVLAYTLTPVASGQVYAFYLSSYDGTTTVTYPTTVISTIY